MAIGEHLADPIGLGAVQVTGEHGVSSAGHYTNAEGRRGRGAEESDPEKIGKLRRRAYSPEDEAKIGSLVLATFKVVEERPLLGAGPSSAS